MPGFVIKNLVAICSKDDGKGDEGIMAFMMPDGSWMPMVAADEVRLKQLVPMAEQVKKQTGVDYQVLRFSVREDITDEHRPKE